MKKDNTKRVERENFSLSITKIVEENECNYIDAILHYCDENSLDIEDVPKIIDIKTKVFLEKDAMSLNFIAKENSLDI
jgi:hypothetical protein